MTSSTDLYGHKKMKTLDKEPLNLIRIISDLYNNDTYCFKLTLSRRNIQISQEQRCPMH